MRLLMGLRLVPPLLRSPQERSLRTSTCTLTVSCVSGRTVGPQKNSLIITSFVVQHTSCIERALDLELLQPACQRADTCAMRKLELLIEVQGAGKELPSLKYQKNGCH